MFIAFFLYTNSWPFEPLFTKISFVLNLAYKINIDIIETTKVNQRLQGKNTVSISKEVFKRTKRTNINFWRLIFTKFFDQTSFKQT